jgi:hypothetical protein
VLGHVSRGELSECKHDPVGRELPDWLALVDHLKVGIFILDPYHLNPDPDPAFHFSIFTHDHNKHSTFSKKNKNQCLHSFFKELRVFSGCKF